MIFPLSLGRRSCQRAHQSEYDRRILDDPQRVTWNDPRRMLYPHHLEFWPQDLPEHVLHRQTALRLRRHKQRAWLRAFIRFQWFVACIRFLKQPVWPGSLIDPPLDPQHRPDDPKRL